MKIQELLFRFLCANHDNLCICREHGLGVRINVDAVIGMNRDHAAAGLLADGAVGQGLMLNYMVPNVVFKGDFDTVRFALRLARKDIGLASELGREYEVPMKVANIVEQDLIEAMAKGWGDRDSTVPFQLQEERAGVKVRKA